MSMKRYSTFPRSPDLDLNYHMQFGVIHRTPLYFGGGAERSRSSAGKQSVYFESHWQGRKGIKNTPDITNVKKSRELRAVFSFFLSLLFMAYQPLSVT